MGSLNKVMIIGRLGADPELKSIPSGQTVATFSLATDERWTNRDGERQERTEWHRVVVWGKLAGICGEYLAKGRQVYIEGRIQTRNWEDKDGNKRYMTEIVATDMQMLGSRGEAGPPQAGSSSGEDSGGPLSPPPGPEGDDIPF